MGASQSKSGSGLSFNSLTDVFDKLEHTASTLQMIDILAEFFRKCSPTDAKIAAYMMRGQVAPEFVHDMDFGVAKVLAARAVASAYQKKVASVEALMHKKGDLGLAAEELSGKRKIARPVMLNEVFERLTALALASGQGSQEQKLEILAGLLDRATGREARYIVRIVLATLRIGVAEMTFLSALSVALTGSKDSKPLLESAFNVMPDMGEIAERAMSQGVDNLENIEPQPGVPVRVMLAQRVKELGEVGKNIPGEVYVEYKYDGERVQAHIVNKSTVRLYSRRHEDITHQFPDLISALKKSFAGKKAIVEGEVVAVDKNAPNKMLPFQVLMQRRRKHNIEKYMNEIPIRYMIFDILSLDNRSMMKLPLKDRKKAISKSFSSNGAVELVEGLLTNDLLEEQEFFENAVSNGAEGIMIKDALSPYKAGARGWQWIKFKKDYSEGLADSFDLVVVGALHGAGRRGGTYGSLLAASYDPESGKYYSFTKVGAGLTDENLATLNKKLNKFKRKDKHPMLETGMDANVWFEPQIVLEVEGAEITSSPIHCAAREQVKNAGLAHNKNAGLALRFPRFIRWRNDKKPTQATTNLEIFEMYQATLKRGSF